MAGRVRALHLKGRSEGPTLPKLPQARVRIGRAGVEGDHNAYRTRRKAGDPDMAVLVLPAEVLDALRADGWPVGPGHLGENVTTEGVPYDAMPPGTRLAVGGVLLEVSKACDPCTTLYRLPYVGEARGPAFLKATLGRRGWYCRVLEEGEVAVGDPVELR